VTTPPQSTQRQDAHAGDDPNADEPKTDPAMRLPVSKKEMRKAFKINEIWTFVVAVATAGAALLTGYALFISKAEAAGEKKAESVAKELVETNKRMDKVEAQQAEVRLDMRDLYKATLYGKRSERLEKPPEETKDGGQ
jgi:hypothetical protein